MMYHTESRKRIKIKYIIVFTLLLLFISISMGSLYLVNHALTPLDTVKSRYADSEQLMETEYHFYKSWRDSLLANNSIKDTFILNDDGIRLHANYIKASRDTTATAVIVHGYVDNNIRMMMIAYMYSHDLGFNVLLPDLQYHGKSEGKAIQMGWKDRLDVMKWIDVANDIFGGNTKMVIHGLSMGGATTMMVSGERNVNKCVKAYIEDCGYTSVWDQFRKELKEDFHLPAFPLLYTSDWLCRAKYGWGFKEASAISQVAKCEKPIMFIHGDKDEYVPTEMVYKLYEAKRGDKEIWVVKGAEHFVSYRDNQKEYTKRVNNFVSKYLK